MLDKIKNLRGSLYRKLSKKPEKKEKNQQEVDEGLHEFELKKPVRIVELPDVKDISKIDVTYPLIEPFAFANIKWDEETKELVYNSVEPTLTEEDKAMLHRISEAIIELVDVGLSTIKETSTALDYLQQQVNKIVHEFGLKLTQAQYAKVMYYVYRNFVGYNEIEAFLQDPNIEDISCDGIKTPLYVIHRKYGSLKTNVSFNDLDGIREFVVKLAERAGRFVSYAEPILDGTLPDGSRVSATLAGDVATRGPTFTIRKFSEKPFSPIDQLGLNTISPEMLAYFWYLVEHGASVLVVGGVATGKCIKPNDMVQMSNGEIKSIEDVYAQVCKERKPIEMLTLAPDLKFYPVKVNKFWRFAPPAVLVNIKTESGSTVTTTPEHEFICIRRGRIERVRSDRLKINDFIASPRKLAIQGKPQAIPLDWCDNSLYVPSSDEFAKEVMFKIKEKYKTLTNLARNKNLAYKRVESWCKGKNSIPLSIVLELARELGILRNPQTLKTKTGKLTTALKPITATSPELLRLVGYLIGDGGIYNNGIQFFNKSKDLRDNFKNIAKKLGLTYREEFPKNRVAKIIVQNKPFELFLREVFNLKVGKKASIASIPTIVMKCSAEEIREFVKGLFDSEAYVSAKECEIEFSTASELLAYQLSAVLRRFGIVGRLRSRRYKNSAYFRVVISGATDLRKFEEQIGFTERRKLLALDAITNKIVHMHTNVDIVPAVDAIKEVVRKNNLTISLIASRAGIARESLRDIIHGRANPSYDMLRKIARALETFNIGSDILHYLKLLSDSDIFWDKIKSVGREVCKEKYVYDFTVDDTHNFLGGNGGGFVISNTSFLNSISMFIQPEAKIVSIEDTRELRLPHEHWLPGLSRTGFGIPMPTGEKYGEVSLFDLLKESFRQNPDYVIVGEVRGKETYVMFQGMSSGHPSMATFHAGSIDTVIKRLTTPPIELSPTLLESLDVIAIMTHAKEKGKSERRIAQIAEIVSVDPKTDEVKTNVVFDWDPATDTYTKVADSLKVEKVTVTKGGNVEEAKREIERRVKILEWMNAKGIKDYTEVAKIISQYYKEPNKVLAMVGEQPVAKKEEPVQAPAAIEVKTEERPKKRVSLLDLLGFRVVKEKT